MGERTHMYILDVESTEEVRKWGMSLLDMVSFSNRNPYTGDPYKTQDLYRREKDSSSRLREQVRILEKKIKKLEKENYNLKYANQEVAYWKDTAEFLQEYIDILEGQASLDHDW